jgi:hypothetical protein
MLDIILGNAGNIFSTGELNRFAKRNGIPNSARDEEVADFWKGIVNDIAADGYQEPGYYYQLSKKFEYHSSFPLALGLYNKSEFEKYAGLQRSLFTAISNAAADRGKEIIIDSSKYPLRGLILSKIFNKQISYIYLVRNPVSVVNSFGKKGVEQPPKNALVANTYLFFVSTLAKYVVKLLKKNHKVSTVSFENLLAEPVKTLSKIEKDIDVDLSKPKQLIEQNQPFEVGYLFDGNRLRLNKNVIIRRSNLLAPDIKGLNNIFYPLHKFAWYKS